MCSKAQDILDSDYYFERGEFFFHPNIGINIVDEITSNDMIYIPGENVKINMKECTWLPSENTLRNLADSMNLNQESLDNFLNDDKGYSGYPKGKKPGDIFKLPEAQWLAHYLNEKDNSIWSQKQKKWIK